MAVINLKVVEARSKLKPRHEPYYSSIRKGCSLGFRRLTSGSVGTWYARCRHEVTGALEKTSLGTFENLPAHQRYDAALNEAETWFKRAGMGLTAEVKTVREACEAYVTHVRTGEGDKDKSKRKADEAAARFTRWVYAAPLAKLALSKLTMGAFEKWRRSLAATPVIINPHAPSDEQRSRERSAAAVNRDVAAFRAALNFAHKRGYVASDVTWLAPLAPTRGADKARDIYLTKNQRRALLEAAPPDLVNFIAGLCALPLRPGALAALKVGNYNQRLCVLTVPHDKSGADRKVKLPAQAAEMFKGLCKDKLPGAPIFARSNGKAWDRHSWKKPFKAAVDEAKLPSDATAYSLRHSTITDLCQSGGSLLTIARLSGTSMEMIDRHYGHVLEEQGAETLTALSL